MPGPELSVYYICPLCHVTYLTVGKKKQSRTNGFCFIPGERCEHGEAGLGQTPSFKVLLVLAASPCVYLTHSLNLGGEFIVLMLLSQNSSYLTSSKGQEMPFFVCKLTKEKKRYSNYSMHGNILFLQAASVFNIAVY